VVFNGELFDYPEVRAELMSRGHTLRTHADTEIIPHLYEEHGDGMLAKLRGQFAFALWDENRHRLVLARDRFGICPLYWTRRRTAQGELLLFASEVKALLASGLISARPDPRGINHAFTFFALPGPVTCFQDIEILLPGHYLTIDLGRPGESARVQNRIYWEIDFPDAGHEEHGGLFAGRSAERIVDDYEAVMMRATEKRLRADVRVVSYLWGGVDRSVVVALACHARRREGKGAIPTFTISIQDPELNEEAEAGIVSRHLDCRPVVGNCGRREVLETYPELTRAAEGPVIDTACAALLMLAREVHAQGYKVALTGEGADEWLAGYPWYKVHKLLGALDIIPGVRLSGLIRRAYLKLTGAPAFPWHMSRRVEDAIGGPNAWLNIYGLFSTAKLRFFSREMWDRLGDHVPYEDLGLNL